MSIQDHWQVVDAPRLNPEPLPAFCPSAVLLCHTCAHYPSDKRHAALCRAREIFVVACLDGLTCVYYQGR